MTPTKKLKSILDNQYESEDGDAYTVELLEGMGQPEIEQLKKTLPNQHLPTEIEELLKFSRGFEFYGLEEVRFDSFGHFGFEEVFPNSIQLAGDGFGNYWILDIDSKGNWNEVFYVCHDPAVIVKHSNDLTQFIEHVDEFGRMGGASNLDTIHEKIVFDIWNEKVGIMERNERDYDFESTIELPESFLIADLTSEPIKKGFAWGKFGTNSKIIRPTDQPIWVVEKKIKQGFLARLFNRSGK
ncbi:SMI1/KNR4 family protein [Pontibacter sp. G13]|uniref:SMI1/KNR4 family protein n=1 Tax=Pontibacter sp. G13 TaxID=3074898 RepID=UPI00288C35AC|nr:SMI1/KNR4 family protein [Pontibacter sp. G13]WNJ17120.1 SMI1/KNR4 family protein [Pontibacter sp. G13]